MASNQRTKITIRVQDDDLKLLKKVYSGKPGGYNAVIRKIISQFCDQLRRKFGQSVIEAEEDKHDAGK
jgi:hypothetical protein